jgi:hypothetical protein
MWLYIIAVFLLIFGIVGSVLSGGIFTIVLIPLGFIALVSAMVHGSLGQGAQRREGPRDDGHSSVAQPLPVSEHSNTASAPTTPEQLADARRLEQ